MDSQEKPFNQSAFPIGKQIQLCEQGMTLKDHFAGLAMQSLFANKSMVDTMTDYSIEWVAKFSYAIADAMLKQRSL